MFIPAQAEGNEIYRSDKRQTDKMTQEERIKELKAQNDKLRRDNLFMRLHLEVIAENPESKAAKKIIARYRRLMLAREERLKEIQN